MKKQFDIKKIKTVFICPDVNGGEKYVKRKEHMVNLLENIIKIERYKHFASSSENYPVCLSKAIAEILKQNFEEEGENNDEPLLILEDDVEFTGIDTFEIDEEYANVCDAVYLGISKSGGHPFANSHLDNAVFQNLNETQVRVFNMLSHHAVLYISKRYKEKCIETLEKTVETSFYNDVAISQIQKDFFIVANKKPSFYQSSKFGPKTTEDCTNFKIVYAHECQQINFELLNNEKSLE